MHIDTKKHLFALYYDNVNNIVATKKVQQTIIISDKNIYHRIVNVLRLKPEETCIFFTKTVSLHLCIDSIAIKNQIQGTIEKIEKYTPLYPDITFLLPLLKRESYETTLYALSEIGVTTIQPIVTEKTHKKRITDKDQKRAQKIIIAAAEQSKNFAFPEIKQPELLEKYIDTILQNTHNIFFDPTGIPLLTHLNTLKTNNLSHITLMIGPEGDLTLQEKNLLKKANFTFCVLTPTILRASQAAAVSAGIIRSYFY